MPRVLILIPCRNQKAYIVQCIESIFMVNQPDINLAIAVVDGVSDDGTRTIVNRYVKKFTIMQFIDKVFLAVPVLFIATFFAAITIPALFVGVYHSCIYSSTNKSMEKLFVSSHSNHGK